MKLLISILFITLVHHSMANDQIEVNTNNFESVGSWVDQGMKWLGYEKRRILNCGGGGISLIGGVGGFLCIDSETSDKHYAGIGSVGLDVRVNLSGLHVRCYYETEDQMDLYFYGGRGGIAIPFVSLGADIAVLRGENGGICMFGSGGFGRISPISVAAMTFTFGSSASDAKDKILKKMQELWPSDF